MFDNKPLVVKPWQSDVDLLKEEVKVVPAWIKLYGLPLKFWGKCMPKIAALVGPYVRSDPATEAKTRLGYARVMVELKVGHKFPTCVQFKDEHGSLLKVKVEYDWKPSICLKCKGMGHETTECRKSEQKKQALPVVRKEWRPVPQAWPIGLLETKISGGNVANVTLNLFDGWCVTTNSYTHKGGRVWMLWKPQLFYVHVLAYNPQFIYAKITVKVTGKSFFLTLIYAFNDGGQTKDEDMEAFVDCVTACGMVDIQATGAFFTWTNKQDAEHRKYSRLDRFLVNNEWLTGFPDMIGHFHPEAVFLPRAKTVWDEHIQGTRMFCIAKKLKQNHLLITQEREALENLRRLTKARDSFLSQKAKSKWLEEDDANTAYFHAAIRKRCMSNTIIQIEDQHGRVCSETQSIQDAFLEYYNGLLGSRKLTDNVRSAVLDFGKYCNEEHISILNKPVLYEEVKQVVFSIPIDKSPGPDGYTSGFFRDSWELIGNDVVKAVISKLLCNILALVLPDIIHESQGAFVQARSIIENVLICQDIVHQYSRKNVSPRCLFKIDLQKAYDTVEWDFVKQLLTGLKFPSKFVGLLMACITTTSYTLVLNGNNFWYFKGERGLRQGDPVSPLIFTICMDYLTRLIAFAISRWPFHYHPMCKAIKLTHLMFADDLLMFCKGDAPSIILLMKAFISFSNASGLQMNNTKSEIFFNGMKEELQKDILSVTGFQEGKMPFRYLGVPIQPGKISKKDCSSLVEKMVTRIRSHGRVVLINSVLNTLYNYWAAMFVIPKAAIKRVEVICRNYLWDSSTEYHRVPLVGWDRVTMPKAAGGLGIKKASVWNIASLLVSWLTGFTRSLIDYGSNGLTVSTSKGLPGMTIHQQNDSTWTWKSICKVKEKIKDGFIDNVWTPHQKGYTIGDGYDWLMGNYTKQQWFTIVWNDWNIPKASSISWLIMQEGINIKSKLYAYGFCQDDR
ncbi:uncharacterized protein LOC141618753 [Silene latifolia]|uniref:uncharacterized protein LOC141618753 n=1 Tax=Silene latifolia TaxID=37657 RepID=UPI003D77AAFB